MWIILKVIQFCQRKNNVISRNQQNRNAGMKILYYDCFAGISGDMNLGALIDLGVDVEFLKGELAKLPVQGYTLSISREMRKGISGTRVDVILDAPPNRQANLSPAHSHSVSPAHSYSISHSHSDSDSASHSHNSFREIREMINHSNLSQQVKDASLAIFSKVAIAEGKIHGNPTDNVQFHEVGAIDSIVDIVGAAICLNHLSPDQILCSTVEVGGGTVRCAHGIYPVPAPATAEILTGIPIRKGTIPYEATTPTGAAILAANVNEFTDRTGFKVLKTGYGVGSRDGEIPNVLRVFLCETDNLQEEETVASVMIECNIDDMNPELYDYLIDAFFSAGAKDVFITPIIMKKSRPAVKLSVLCAPENQAAVNEVFFRETSTLGVRSHVVEKTMLDRSIATVQTPHGEIRVKSAFYHGKWIKSKPEYEDCLAAAKAKKIPIAQVYRDVEKALNNQSQNPYNP
jgi:uncharacterized protein (TIGR00299 family) protein